jgi:hypothetical protein
MGAASRGFKAAPPDCPVRRFARGPSAPVISRPVRTLGPPPLDVRESMSRDHNPVPGKWYESLDDEEIFRVLSVDEDAELIELQYEDGDVEEIDYETWQELDLELSQEPEGWSGSEDEEDEEEDDDLDDDDEDDDDWDDDEDEDDDDDYGDRDDY